MKATLVPVHFPSGMDTEFTAHLALARELLAEEAEVLPPVALGAPLPAADAVIFPQLLGEAFSRLKELGHVIPNRRAPLRHLGRMHPILSRQLRDRLKPNQGFESYLGLEGRTMPFAFCFHSLLSLVQQTGESPS